MSASGAARGLLVPLIPLYRIGLTLRELRLAQGWEPIRRLRDPVVSIGNLSTGGSGKTPLTIALAQALTRRGIAVDVLSRGYGRTSSDPTRVDPAGAAADFGDEPLLIARAAGVPVYIARQRYEAGILAESEAQPEPALRSDSDIGDVIAGPGHEAAGIERSSGKFSEREPREPGPGGAVQPQRWESTEIPIPAPEGVNPPSAATGTLPRLHLLDDGFQHRQLHRDFDILLLSRSDWHDRLLPAGNLRETLHAARRASVLAVPADDPAFETDLRAWGWQGPVWRLHRRMDVPPLDGPAIAFCGIARPTQFFCGLRAAGVPLADSIAYSDHHRFTPRNLQSIVLAARTHQARCLITTEKDRVRLGSLAATLPPDLSLHTARLRVEIEEEGAALDWLTSRLRSLP